MLAIIAVLAYWTGNGISYVHRGSSALMKEQREEFQEWSIFKYVNQYESV